MYDYMRALQQKFFTEPDCTELRQEIQQIHHHMKSKLSRENRRQLLKLIDLEMELCEQISLSSFAAGFRLATGIAEELSREEPYSFERDEEQRAAVLLEEELNL